MIYLAAPYTHPDPEVVKQRIEAFYKKQVQLIHKGHYVVSPLDKIHMATIHQIKTNWDWWKEYSAELMDRCDTVYILMLDGWEESIGVQEEIKLAISMKKPIYYVGAN